MIKLRKEKDGHFTRLSFGCREIWQLDSGLTMRALGRLVVALATL